MTAVARDSGIPDTCPADPFRERVGDYIQVRSGGTLWPFDPRPEEIHLSDIAYALSRVCRYTGHTAGAFGLSVAQHSVMVSRSCDPADALAGLLHDASDMAFNDIARPLKYMPEYVPIRDAEGRLQAAIYRRFGLAPDKPHSVHVADNRVLAAEVRDLMTPDPRIWGKWLDEIEPVADRIWPWPPREAEEAFLLRFEEITGNSRFDQ
jgi:hypothetical protein